MWGWVKDYVHPRLEARIDLAEPVAQLREVLPAFGVGDPGSPLDEALGQLTLDDVELSDGFVVVRVRIPVPDAPATTATPAPAGTVAPLSPDELRRWQQALEQWDAFLTFIVKVTGGDTQVLALRRTLLSILLEERYALSEALSSPRVRVHDPVRPLFLRAWERLAPTLREVADGLPADQALRYLSFVSAGDALQALDQLGPDSGIEISADGLRRLARLMAPSSSEDPLAYVPGVDPQLRELFGFGPPLPAPEENADVDAAAGADAGDADATAPSPGGTPAATSTPDASSASATTAPPTPATSTAPGASATTIAPPPSPSPDASPTTWLWHFLGGTAWAAELPEPDVAKRLNAWAPTRTDIAEYAPLARQLLDSVTTWLLERHEIDPAHVAVFRALVPATAWKESCWRQYVRKDGKLVTLTSGAGAVGIMQVNVNVWRGFYDPGGLKRDVAYNARAGGEILSRYWTDYAVARGEAAKGGGVDALARATYAAYNGGPSELTRYRDKRVKKRERVVDTDFFVKYQRMKAGDTLAVVDCYVD
jgi:soluble lytic murein transglycosylase-like protein